MYLEKTLYLLQGIFYFLIHFMKSKYIPYCYFSQFKILSALQSNKIMCNMSFVYCAIAVKKQHDQGTL